MYLIHGFIIRVYNFINQSILIFAKIICYLNFHFLFCFFTYNNLNFLDTNC